MELSKDVGVEGGTIYRIEFTQKNYLFNRVCVCVGEREGERESNMHERERSLNTRTTDLPFIFKTRSPLHEIRA